MGTLVGMCVPKMGMHAMPVSELHATTRFQKTMLVGYDHGQPIFLEAMITRVMLLQRRSFGIDIPQVPDPPSGVGFPTTFRADYDGAAQSYGLVFSGLAAGGTH